MLTEGCERATMPSAQEDPYSFRDRLVLWVVPWLLHWAIAFIGWTLRIQVVGGRHPQSVAHPQGGVIWALWHGRMFIPLYAHRNQGACVLVSQHRDGELIARVLLGFGYDVARGSTTRGGSRALMEMIRKARPRTAFAFTPDGPRGPKSKVQPGVLLLAQRSGFPIVPVAGGAAPRKVFSSWDGFVLPMPFSKASVVYGEPLFVDRQLSEESMESLGTELERRLNAATATADALCGR